MKKSQFLLDFKQFVMRGNVVDMAVGIIIGAAFGKIVSSLVSDIFMPVIGLLLGGVDFTSLKWVIKDAVVDGGGKIIDPAVVLNYGTFIQTTVDFIIIAFAIFLIIKGMAKMSAKKPEAPAAPPAPTPEVELLTEIRDLLKEDDKK